MSSPPATQPLTIASSDVLDGKLSFDEIVAAHPTTYTIKGMFFGKHVDLLGPEWKALEPTLLRPPRLGRYLPFRDYPQVDYIRLAEAIAAKRFPRVSQREAVRLLARDDMVTFGESVLGKILLSAAGDATAALLSAPGAYAKVSTGAKVTAAKLDECKVRVEFRSYYGSIEYTLGQLEGVAQHFGEKTVTTIAEIGAAHVAFDVAWGA